MTLPKPVLKTPVWRTLGGSDSDWYSAVVATYEGMSSDDKARVMRLSKQLEAGLRDTGRKGALALLAAIGLAMEGEE